MSRNPTSPPRNIIPNFIPFDALAICLVPYTESFTGMDLTNVSVAGTCTFAAVHVIVDGRVERTPFVCTGVKGGGIRGGDRVGERERK